MLTQYLIKIFFSIKWSFSKIFGDYYSPFKIKKILEELDELIDNNNLQFVEHNVQEVIEGDTINIVLNVLRRKNFSREN